jgi:hypothetical protein
VINTGKSLAAQGDLAYYTKTPVMANPKSA